MSVEYVTYFPSHDFLTQRKTKFFGSYLARRIVKKVYNHVKNVQNISLRAYSPRVY